MDQHDYRFITFEPARPVVTVTLNHSEKRNALSLEMMRELTHALVSAGEDPKTRVVIIRANGPVFSSGHDLRELQSNDAAAQRETFALCVGLMETLQRIPQPVIAEVAGLASAAGCQLVAACDLVMAAANAKFAVPGVRIGLFCSTPMVALTRVIGRKRAMEMLLTGDPIDAQTAADWGLVNHVVPIDELNSATWQLAQKIASLSGPTIALGKKAYYAQLELAQADAYSYTREVMSSNLCAPDAREGMAAFLEKRTPNWRDQ